MTSSEFIKVRLGDIADIQTGPFGSQLHKRDYKEKGTPIITVEHLGQNRIIHKNLPFVSDEDKERLKKFIIKEGDIVFSRVGSVDRRAFVCKKEDGWLFSGRCLRVRVFDNNINPLYLSYYFGLENFKEYIRRIAVGATMPSLNTKIMSDIEVKFPAKDVQDYIAVILSSLDDKIEFNNRINQTLEEIAQGIFKHWFVDFEFPDENGQPYKSSGGEMDDSEFGPIPKGWKVLKIGDIIELAYGKALKKDNRELGIIPVVGSNGIIDYHKEALVKGPGIVIGRKGNPGTVNYIYCDFFPIDTTFYVIPKGEVNSFYYLYWALREQGFDKLSTDSAVPGLNRNIAYMNSMLIPEKKTIEEFDTAVKPLYRSRFINSEQVALLCQVRDTLLPKLMSGEIRVPVEEVLEVV